MDEEKVTVDLDEEEDEELSEEGLRRRAQLQKINKIQKIVILTLTVIALVALIIVSVKNLAFALRPVEGAAQMSINEFMDVLVRL